MKKSRLHVEPLGSRQKNHRKDDRGRDQRERRGGGGHYKPRTIKKTTKKAKKEKKKKKKKKKKTNKKNSPFQRGGRKNNSTKNLKEEITKREKQIKRSWGKGLCSNDCSKRGEKQNHPEGGRNSRKKILGPPIRRQKTTNDERPEPQAC